MKVYLVSNNLVVNNISYESTESIEAKRISRPLSIDGDKEAKKLIDKIDADIIYSSNYASAIESARFYSEAKGENIIINSSLNDSKIGDVKNRNIKMLRYMQERDFNFKFDGGESLNETHYRMNTIMNKIVNKYPESNVVVFTHRRSIIAYLLKYLEKGYNLDDNLILSLNDKVIIDDVERDIDIVELFYVNGKIVDANVIE